MYCYRFHIGITIAILHQGGAFTIAITIYIRYLRLIT